MVCRIATVALRQFCCPFGYNLPARRFSTCSGLAHEYCAGLVISQVQMYPARFGNGCRSYRQYISLMAKYSKSKIASSPSRETLLDSETVIPFGKYVGEDISVLLSDENYINRILRQRGMLSDLQG